MKQPVWKDTSSWCRTDVGTPKEWTCEIGPVRVVVHHIHGCGDTWYASFHPALVPSFELPFTDAESGKAIALRRLREAVDALAKMLPAAKGEGAL